MAGYAALHPPYDFVGLRGALAEAGDHLLQRGDADPVAEIAKALSGNARGRPEREQRVERIGEAGDVEPLGDDLVEPGALEIAADIQRIKAGHPTDDADIAAISPG